MPQSSIARSPIVSGPVVVDPPRTPVIVTIDGPAGTGKSSIARALAHRLNLRVLDTGAMYRAAAAIVIDHDLPLRRCPRHRRQGRRGRPPLRLGSRSPAHPRLEQAHGRAHS